MLRHTRSSYQSQFSVVTHDEMDARPYLPLRICAGFVVLCVLPCHQEAVVQITAGVCASYNPPVVGIGLMMMFPVGGGRKIIKKEVGRRIGLPCPL